MSGILFFHFYQLPPVNTSLALGVTTGQNEKVDSWHVSAMKFIVKKQLV